MNGCCRFLRCWRVLRRCPARAVEAYQSVLLYGMSHDGTAVAVVPVLMIRMMLTKDNQRCAGALECYQEAPELRVQGAGRAVVVKELRLKPDEARVCILLFSNVEGKLCLEQAARWRRRQRTAAAEDVAEKEKFPCVLAFAKKTFLDRDLAMKCSAGQRLCA